MKATALLLVEDDPQDAELTLRALGQIGSSDEVLRLSDGEAALDYMFRTGHYANLVGDPLPRLVLLDLHLSKLDGLDVLRRLKNDPRTQMTPVVILTSSTEERHVGASYRLGANSYLVKPVDFGQYMQRVAQVSQYWLTCNQPPPAAFYEE